ncbi:MAG: hypothetical protein ABI323_02780 [Solirubrobacteraceae bacterium]
MSFKVMEALGILLLMFPVEALGIVLGEGSRMQRRPHFPLRLVLVTIAMPGLLLALVVLGSIGALPEGVVPALMTLLVFCCIPALMLAPALLFSWPSTSPGDDGNGGPPPPDEPPPQSPPMNGLPLPDADPAGWRVRGHVTAGPGDRGRRGPARKREPEREPPVRRRALG